MALTDYFAAEDLLLNRLRATVEGVESFLSVADMESLEAQKRKAKTPAIWVAYAGDNPGDIAVKGRFQVEDQLWLVVVVVATTSGLLGAPERKKAGPIVVQTIKSLGGYTLSPDFEPLKRQKAPPIENGSAYTEIPLLYSVRTVL